MDPITKLELYALMLLALAGATAGAYFYAYHNGELAERARNTAKEALATKADLQSMQDAVNASTVIAGKTAAQVAAQRAEQAKATGDLKNAIAADPTRYRLVCFTADSDRVLWNALATGSTNVPVSSPGLKLDATLSGGNGASGSGQPSGNASPQLPVRTGNVRPVSPKP
jgi:hypothetical protein